MSEYLVDLIRFTHLVSLAAGMGSGIYFDLHALRRINKPFTRDDIAHFHMVHKVVFVSLLGLWLSGLFLIYIRTGFILSEFTPKLWFKIIIVNILTANAISIGLTVLPRINRSVGLCALTELPLGTILSMTTTTALSMFCWSSCLMLGVSVVLKTASWTILSTFFVLILVIIIFGASFMILIIRDVMRSQDLNGRAAQSFKQIFLLTKQNSSVNH
jgi:hypothetical protein